MANSASHGKSLWSTLLQHLRAYLRGPETVTKSREIIWDVNAQGNFVNGQTADTCLARARNILVMSGRIYRWENTLCYEVQEPGYEQLLILASRDKAFPGAAGVLSNLFCVAV